MTFDDATPVFYVPGRTGIVDLAIMRDGVLRSQVYNETIDELRQRYPGAQVGQLGPVAQATDDAFRSPPVEITQQRFWDMLEVLPPVAWVRRTIEENKDQTLDNESFKISERTCGSITAIFCRIGSRYFELQDSITMRHDDILRAVLLAYPDCATQAA